MRVLKNEDTPILRGLSDIPQLPETPLGVTGQDSAEACGIEIQGDNKWITLIQNAAIQGRKSPL
jgi:putative transposase